jgi:hemerythrin-like domain-containing protein
MGGTIMNAAELKAAVDTVEQDHELVLEKLKALKDTIYCLLEPAKTTSGEMVDELVEFNKYFATKFESHLDEEETTLFPLLEKHTSTGPEIVARLRQQHKEIRRKRQEFEDCLESAARQEEEHIAPSILQQLLCPCVICRQLGIHVVIFRGAERNRRRGFHNLFVTYTKLRGATNGQG